MFKNIDYIKINLYFHDMYSTHTGLTYLNDNKKLIIDVSLLNKIFGISFFDEFHLLFYFSI